MSAVFSLFFFFIYKLFILADLKYWIGLFPLRIEPYIIYFYSFLSLFQLAFVTYCIFSFSRKDRKIQFLSLMDNFSFLIVTMEIVNLALAGFFLLKCENDFYRLYFLFLTTFLIHPFFYMIFRINSYYYLRRSPIETLKIRVAGKIIFNLIVFSLTILYIYLKVFKEKKFFSLDIGLTTLIMTLNLFVLLILELLRIFNLKRFAARFAKEGGRDFETIYLQTLLKRYNNSNKFEQDDIFTSDYISNNLKDNFLKKGLSLDNKEHNVVLLSVRVKIADNASLESDELKDFVKTLGLFAREYDAFPFFGTGHFLLVFGFPADYKHKSYNAIEVAERLIRDSSRMVEGNESKFYVFAGICEGIIKAYMLPLRNSRKNDIYLKGAGAEFAEKISGIAAKENIPLLISSDFYNKMKNRIYVSRALKVKERDEEKILYQVKL
ncbi:MAG: hypothetical protein ACP5QT_00160 [Brevinematia bacterium]